MGRLVEQTEMIGTSNLRSWLFERRLDDDFARIWGVLCRNPESVVLGVGILLRLIVYWDGRSFWMDEASLWGNLAGKRILDFSETLSGDQLAPIGFMIAERSIMSILGISRYASRLLPLFSGLAAIVLFARLVPAILPRRPALVALALFAFSDDLIYYASELKPYSTDLAIGLAITLVSLDSLGKSVSLRRLLVVAFAAAAVPWFSFASAFIVAGCGVTLVLASLAARRWREVALWGAIGGGWLISLILSYRASAALLSPYTTMYLFWDFAFLPVWPLPTGRERLGAVFGILMETFVTPLNLVAPFWPWVGVVIPGMLMACGTIALARRSWPTWAILVAPIALALIASAIKRYPFHGRLILELVPALLILIAEGTEVIRRLPGETKIGYRVVLIILFAYSGLVAFKNSVWVPLREFNRHGDLRANLFITQVRSRTIGTGQKVGMTIFSPPFMADSCAQSPTMVQLAEVSASGIAGLSPFTADKNACTRCGCDPPWPPPCKNERWSAS
jgi:hypothetical protein